MASYINYSLGQTKRSHGSVSQDQSYKDPGRWSRQCSHPQDLQILVIANGWKWKIWNEVRLKYQMGTYPVGLGGAPLDLIDFSLGSGVSQNWVLNGPWHLLDVPDQSLRKVDKYLTEVKLCRGSLPGDRRLPCICDTMSVGPRQCHWHRRGGYSTLIQMFINNHKKILNRLVGLCIQLVKREPHWPSPSAK